MTQSISTLYVCALGLGLLCGSAWFAEAQTTTDNRPDSREERQAEIQSVQQQHQAQRAELQENRASTSAAREEQREERRAALTERAQERITNLAANMSNRLEAVIARFTQITDRLESRIEILNERGVNTETAAAQVAEARAHIAVAAESISTIDTLVGTVVGSETPRAAWQSARTTFVTTRTELKAAHEALRLSVAALKEAVAATDANGVSDAVRAEQSFNSSTSTESSTTSSGN